MLFNSFDFLFFFLIVYAIYLVLNHRWQNLFLILASCLFYAAWNWKFLFVMFFSITTDFICAKYMGRTNDAKIRRLLLVLSITVNLAILGFFKYYNFFFGHLYPLNIILPLAVSFYTFEAISYTVDVYNKVIKPTSKYRDYLLFVIYFPHLVAGPIMRAKDFLPQIIAPRVIKKQQFWEGCQLIFWGLFEKMFVADNLAKIVDPIFAGHAPYQGTMVLLAIYAFAFQIFCDFDGYSNIARGLGKLMGFDITINFKWPYFTSNPVDFWRSWHISLSSWLRDYVYIPLGGNRFTTLLTLRNLFLVMLIGGLWHGANWTFVAWGAYHGVLLILYKLKKFKVALPGIIKTVIFFHLVALGWLLFRAQSMGQVGQMLHALIFDFNLSRIPSGFWQLLAFVAPLLLIQWQQWKIQDVLPLQRLPWLVRIVGFALMTYLVLGYGAMRAEQFIYFQF